MNPLREAERGFAQCGILAVAFAAVLILLALAGCSTTGARDRALIAAGQAAATLPAMSDAELTCDVEPRAPSPKGAAARVRESQVTNYILDLREAGADCRDKLGVARRVWRKVEDVRSRAVPPR
ncbi:hypothetical protein [Sphingomonas yantingensis]|uniref:Lipoprotein n=1 Tax=Sphingomonas yantingensis TaxID=1241761 RepID=A0A7W9EKW2_9SPHN|nr:hypothetical protein [Sphingomonas yantingensis]MBB5700036.1 hypothetical protein [Sphingomonas yantingensis]